MTRSLRLEYEGAIYHITSRGNAKEFIFLADSDRSRFLKTLADVVDRFGWICHAYCLMTNHYHLLIETPTAGLSRGMKLLNGTYTQWFNRRYERVGHLFQGRFKAIIVERESHLLELVRYVVLNPVRAKMVQDAGDWPWSSYRATAGQTEVPEFLTVGWVLCQFDRDSERAIHAYCQFVRQGLGINVWTELKAGALLGTAEFVDKLRPMLKEKLVDPEYLKGERFAARPSLKKLFVNVANKATRNDQIYQAVRIHHYTLREVGDHVGLLYSTISNIVKRVHETQKS